jgi:hypothetical protein
MHGINPLTPAQLAGLLALLTALAAGVDAWGRHRRRRLLRRLAAEWHMTYSPRDRWRLSDKVAGRFPVPGAADVHVSDLIYGGDKHVCRYVFIAEFTIGVVRTKRRRVRVGTYTEPRERAGAADTGPFILAPDNLPLLEQYQRLAPLEIGPETKEAPRP